MRQTYLFLVLLLLGACDSNELERSRPHAENWRIATIDEVNNPQVVPDSVNVVAYVVLKKKCPAGSQCMSGNSLILSDVNQKEPFDWDRVIHNTGYIEELRVGKKYMFSIRLSQRIGDPTTHNKKIIGYDPL